MDDLIDRALKSYASREPSPMLESRILAHARRSHRAGTAWLLSAAAMMAATVCIVLLPHRHSARSVAQALPPVHDTESQPYIAPAPIRPLHRRHRSVPEPKLAVFPSPSPIPDAEIALAHTLSGDPDLAASLTSDPAPPELQPITIEPLSIKALDED